MTFRTRILSAAGGLFFLTILVSSLANTMSIYASVWKMLTALAVTFIVVIFVIYWATQRLSGKMFLIVFLTLGLACRVGWILWNPALPESDFLFMYNAAQEAASGNFAYSDSPYYISFPYQHGFTMYEAAVIRLFGNHLIVLKLFNVLFSIGTAVILYFSAKKVFNNENYGRITALIYLFYIPNIIMCSVLTNQHISVFLFLLGCLLLLKGKDSFIYWLLAGLAIGLGNLMRPIGIVYLAGAALFVLPMLWQLWRGSAKRQAGVMAGKLAGVIIVYYLVQLLASASLISSGVTQHSLFEGEKYWKFMVGLNAETNGSWNKDDANYVNQYPYGEERYQAELIKIKERLEDKSEVAALLGRKLSIMWGSSDSAAYWSLRGLDNWELEQKLQRWEGPMYVLMCASGVISMIALWRSGKGEKALLYLGLLLLYIGAHLLVENQPRYRLDLIPVLILLQSYGAYQVFSWLRTFLPSSAGRRREREIGM
ncbi:glycosyltransferase family 39 protein [Paenibacillus sp. YAF4_2]|uniref:glycosyltransferase family 39 protein n=1 Tax=Paenibacillus sp. YAF4_2 TaxID=3233085 RepID=UPI003F980C6B